MSLCLHFLSECLYRWVIDHLGCITDRRRFVSKLSLHHGYSINQLATCFNKLVGLFSERIYTLNEFLSRE